MLLSTMSDGSKRLRMGNGMLLRESTFSGWERPVHPYHLVYRNDRGDAAVCHRLSYQENRQ